MEWSGENGQLSKILQDLEIFCFEFHLNFHTIRGQLEKSSMSCVQAVQLSSKPILLELLFTNRITYSLNLDDQQIVRQSEFPHD